MVKLFFYLAFWFSKTWAPYVGYACGAFALYGFSLGYDLTYLDDNVWLLDYRWYLQDISRLRQVLTQNDILFGQLFYRPLIYVSFILDTQGAGDGYFRYRFTNILLHILNTSLVFLILRSMGYKRALAFWAGMVFLFHPTLVSAVAWIPGRTDSLMALFIFSSFFAFLKWFGNKKPVWMAGHVIFWLAALLTKETAVVLPVMVILYVLSCQREDKEKNLWIWLVSVWIILFAGYYFLRNRGVQAGGRKDVFIMLVSLCENLPAVIPYLGKTLLPFNVSVLPILKDLTFWYGWLVCVIFGLFLWKNKRIRKERIAFAALWFLFFLLPSFVFSFLKHEYRLYIPLLGFLVVLCEMIRDDKRGVYLLVVLSVLYLGVSYGHQKHYQNRYTFWQNAVATSPHSPLAHRNLGAMYFKDQKYDLAEKEFLKALEIHPYEKMCYNNLALIYERQNQPLKAEDAYFKEIEINPMFELVYYNLGLFYARHGKLDNSVQLWERAIQLNPRFLPAYEKLYGYYQQVGNTAKAQHYLMRKQE